MGCLEYNSFGAVGAEPSWTAVLGKIHTNVGYDASMRKLPLLALFVLLATCQHRALGAVLASAGHVSQRRILVACSSALDTHMSSIYRNLCQLWQFHVWGLSSPKLGSCNGSRSNSDCSIDCAHILMPSYRFTGGIWRSQER